MRKPTVVALSVLAFAFALSGLAFAHDHDAKAGASAGPWKGEIVDIACYAPHGAKGAGHADCAKKCAQAGQPIGLLTGDGDLKLLAADHDNGKAFEDAKNLAGSAVEISGKLDSRDGMDVITVTAVKPAA